VRAGLFTERSATVLSPAGDKDSPPVALPPAGNPRYPLKCIGIRANIAARIIAV